ncbi:hypothetical protein VP01_3191g1 [Puccinia sorghi]|uniref:Uncharacterized protein n=1 Tax=Puccinia sorghi TaxID=27349 RepID=A0A0L6UYI9_9BASI|nr:hypothetical protein VP01_3191g1 [Puccinia sorghi]
MTVKQLRCKKHVLGAYRWRTCMVTWQPAQHDIIHSQQLVVPTINKPSLAFLTSRNSSHFSIKEALLSAPFISSHHTSRSTIPFLHQLVITPRFECYIDLNHKSPSPLVISVLRKGVPGDNAIIEVTYWGLGTAKRAFNQSFYSPLYLSSSIPLTTCSDSQKKGGTVFFRELKHTRSVYTVFKKFVSLYMRPVSSFNHAFPGGLMCLASHLIWQDRTSCVYTPRFRIFQFLYSLEDLFYFMEIKAGLKLKKSLPPSVRLTVLNFDGIRKHIYNPLKQNNKIEDFILIIISKFDLFCIRPSCLYQGVYTLQDSSHVEISEGQPTHNRFSSNHPDPCSYKMTPHTYWWTGKLSECAANKTKAKLNQNSTKLSSHYTPAVNGSHIPHFLSKSIWIILKNWADFWISNLNRIISILYVPPPHAKKMKTCLNQTQAHSLKKSNRFPLFLARCKRQSNDFIIEICTGIFQFFKIPMNTLIQLKHPVTCLN